MKQINGITLTALTNGAHIEFMNRVSAIINADDTAKTKLEKYFTPFAAALKKESDDFKTSTKSLKTDEIAEADRLRDKYYNALKNMIKGFVDSPLEEMAAAAKVVNQIVKDYNINTQGQIDKETAELANFIRDLRDEHADEVAKLGLSIYLNALNEQNEKLRDAAADRQAEKEAIVVGASKKNRTATDEQFRLLSKLANSYAFIEGDDALGSVIDKINLEIKHYKEQAIKDKTSLSPTDDSSSSSGN